MAGCARQPSRSHHDRWPKASPEHSDGRPAPLRCCAATGRQDAWSHRFPQVSRPPRTARRAAGPVRRQRSARRARILASVAAERYFDEAACRGWSYANEALGTARRLGRPDEFGVAVSARLRSAEVTGSLRQIHPVLDRCSEATGQISLRGHRRFCWSGGSPNGSLRAAPPACVIGTAARTVRAGRAVSTMTDGGCTRNRADPGGVAGTPEPDQRAGNGWRAGYRGQCRGIREQ